MTPRFWSLVQKELRQIRRDGYTDGGLFPIAVHKITSMRRRIEPKLNSFANGVLIAAIKGNILADTGKEIQMVWNGVAVSGRLLTENPGLVERFLRALAKGREFARRFKEPKRRIH